MHINVIQLERVASINLLGITISDDLTWSSHVNGTKKKVNEYMHSLTLLRRSKVSGSDIVEIFCTMIFPILDYATAVWHPGLTDELTTFRLEA